MSKRIVTDGIISWADGSKTGSTWPISELKLSNSVDEWDALNDFASTSLLGVIGEVRSIFSDTVEPTGFVDRIDSIIFWTDSDPDRTLRIEPDVSEYSFYHSGLKHTKSSVLNAQITNVEGMHYVYFDSSGSLIDQTSFDTSLITEEVLVAAIYWDAEHETAIYVGDERHGSTMDGQTHLYLHTTLGAKWVSGLALNDITIGDGTLDDHAYFSYALGLIRDEDNGLSISGDAVPAQVPILYRDGDNGYWRATTPNNFPVKPFVGGSSRLAWNEWTGSTWKQTEGAEDSYVLAHIVATNCILYPVKAIQGQHTYTNLDDAKDGALSEIGSLLTGSLPFVEFVPLGTIIYKTNSTYVNSIKAKIVEADGAKYIDFRNQSPKGSSFTATDHNSLTGIQGGIAGERYHLDQTKYLDLTDGGETSLHTHDHGALNGRSDDDHSGYAWLTGRSTGQTLSGGIADSESLILKASSSLGTHTGYVDIRDTVTMNSKRIINLASPSAGTDAVNKDFVTDLINGLEWQDPVNYNINYVKTGAGAPTGTATSGERCLNTNEKKLYTYTTGWDAGVACVTGNRYIFKISGTDTSGNSGTYTKDDKIRTYNGSTFIEYIAVEGAATWVEDNDDGQYNFNGTNWVKFGSTVNHENLSGLLGGAVNDHYHLTSAQHTDLTDGNECTSHKHAESYVNFNDSTGHDHSGTGSKGTKVEGASLKATGISDGYILKVSSAVAVWAASVAGIDSSAIHNNVTGEISAITEKTTPVAADLFLIEDSAASNAKKRLQLGNTVIAGDVTGKLSASVVGKIQGYAVESGAPEEGDILVWDTGGSGQWEHRPIRWTREFHIAGTLTAGPPDDKTTWLYVPNDMEVIEVKAWVKTAPTGANLTMEVEYSTNNGTSWAGSVVTSANLVITAGNKYGNTSTITTANLSAGNILRLNIDQVGSTQAGADLVVAVIMKFRDN